MSEAETEQLHPIVVELAEAFEKVDGQWTLPDEPLFAHHKQLQACGPELRDKLITDLIVVAARFEREAPEEAQSALVQLLALSASLLGGVEEAEEAFGGAGVDVAGAKKLIGADGVKFADGSEPEPGEAAASLLGMLKDNK